MTYDNTNSGALFREEKKISDKAPDYRGTLNVDGKEINLAGWIKVSTKTGKKFLSLKVDTYSKQGKEAPVKQETKTNAQVLDELEDIPFNEDR